MSAAADLHPTLTVPGPRPDEVVRWKRRAVLVGIARKALPLAILAILVAMGSWIGIETFKPSLSALSLTADVKMENPHFYGRDKKNRAFQLSAAQATRAESDPDLISLTLPVFALETSRVTAKTGIYRQGSDHVELNGDVVFVDGQGRKLNTQQAFINTRTGVLTNGTQSKGIEIAAPTGHVRSDAYTVNQNGDVTLRGNVHGVIKPRQDKP